MDFVRRINRNIVECKGIFTNPTTPVTFRINRNIVECKDQRRYAKGQCNEY